MSDGGGFEVEVKKHPGASTAVAKGASVMTNGFVSGFFLRSEGMVESPGFRGAIRNNVDKARIERVIQQRNWAIVERKEIFSAACGD